MTKQNQVSLNFDARTALELLQVLDTATGGYSKDHQPERIVRLRDLMMQLDKELEKVIL